MTPGVVVRLLAVCCIVLALGLPVFGCGDGSSSSSSDTTLNPGSGDPLLVAMDETVRNLDWGNIVFNAPSTMRYRDVVKVELLLSPTLSVPALQSRLEAQANVESAGVQISNRMEAALTGIGFNIEALSPDLQAVTTEQVTRWVWEVSPTESGPQELHLSLSAHVGVAGADAPFVVRTFDREIDVDVTVGQRVVDFLRANWTWLWVAVVIPASGCVWTSWRRRRKRAQASEAESPPE